MSPIVRELLMNGLLAGAAVRTAKKSSSKVAFYALAGGLCMLAVVFFAIAGNALLLESFTLPVAAAITGTVILSLAGGIGGYAYLSTHKKVVKKTLGGHGGVMDNIEHTLKGLVEGFEEPVKDNPKMALLMAALAGFAAGDQLSDRVH